jgi:hypothetical protein
VSNINITILGIIDRPGFYLKTRHFGDWILCLQVESTQIGPIEGASLWTGRWIIYIIVIVMLIYHHHKLIDSINLLGS